MKRAIMERRRDSIDAILDDLCEEAKANFRKELWHSVGRWLVPTGIALMLGPYVYMLLK